VTALVVTDGEDNGLANGTLLGYLSLTGNVIDNENTAGQLSWSFEAPLGTFDYLAVGESVELTYTITVVDSHGSSNTQEVVITVGGTNEAPVISIEEGDSATAILDETDGMLSASGTLTVSDLNLTDTVTATVTDVFATGTTDGLQSDHAHLLNMFTTTADVVDSNQLSNRLTWIFNSGNEAFDYLSAGQSLVLTYTVTLNRMIPSPPLAH